MKWFLTIQKSFYSIQMVTIWGKAGENVCNGPGTQLQLQWRVKTDPNEILSYFNIYIILMMGLPQIISTGTCIEYIVTWSNWLKNQHNAIMLTIQNSFYSIQMVTTSIWGKAGGNVCNGPGAQLLLQWRVMTDPNEIPGYFNMIGLPQIISTGTCIKCIVT